MNKDSEREVRLGGHCTLQVGGECFTFPLPRFHESVVSGWAPGHEGEFYQRRWSDAAMASWERRHARHDAAVRRWGWVRRLRVRVPFLWSDEGFYDEDGDALTGRWWGTRELGSILAQRLIPSGPGASGSHLITGNQWESAVLEEVWGVTFSGNVFVGESPRMLRL